MINKKTFCKCSVLNLRIFRTWQKRRVVWTKDVIVFARDNQDVVIDKVPMQEVKLVHDMMNEIVPRKASLLATISTSLTSLPVEPKSETPKQSEKDLSSGSAKYTRSASSFNHSEAASAALEGRGYLNTLQIQTIEDGFNSGRTYYLRASSENVCKNTVRELTSLSIKARLSAQSRSKWMKYQLRVCTVYNSLPFQTIVCLTIFTVRDNYSNAFLA